MINSKSAAEAAPEPTRQGSWRERLVEVVQKHLQDSVKERPVLAGSFEIGGSLPDAEGKFVLKPGAWLERPRGWITVGLRGQFEDNVTLSGFITDPTSGEVMEACSRFALQRRLDEDADLDDVEDLTLAGTWQGIYICAGTVTRLVLTLELDHVPFASRVGGVFEFTVLNDLTPDELLTLTNLVSESLIEIGLDFSHDADVQFYIVDNSGDLQPLDAVAADDDDDADPTPEPAASVDDDSS